MTKIKYTKIMFGTLQLLIKMLSKKLVQLNDFQTILHITKTVCL